MGRGADDVLLWYLPDRTYRRLIVQECTDVNWSRDSSRIATVCEDGTIRLWQVSSGKGHVIHQLDRTAANVAVFSPDGTLLATGDRLHGIDMWRDELPNDATELHRWLHQVTSAEITADDVLATPLQQQD